MAVGGVQPAEEGTTEILTGVVGAGRLAAEPQVEVAGDYAHAKVYFTVLGADPEATAKLLNEKAGYFHSLLFKRLQIHTVPALKFIHDASVEKGFAIDKLIADAVAPDAPKPKLRPESDDEE